MEWLEDIDAIISRKAREILDGLPSGMRDGRKASELSKRFRISKKESLHILKQL